MKRIETSINIEKKINKLLDKLDFAEETGNTSQKSTILDEIERLLDILDAHTYHITTTPRQ